jgi:GNAT superfamily N-acetyltransferase
VIRPARSEELSRLIALGRRFFHDGGKRLETADYLAAFILSHITESGKVCLVSGDPICGALCGVIAPHYFTGVPTAFKTAWYALPGSTGHGARLLRGFEQWARDQGAERIIVSGRDNRTCGFLAHLGYQPFETVYDKELAHD